jgi:hypothetical protein
VFRKNFDEIFGKREEDELKESYKQSLMNKKERVKQANMQVDNIEMEKLKEEQDYLEELKNKL